MLDYAIARANNMQVARVVGVESEMELGFAALPYMPALDQLPGPQRDALGAVCGLIDAAAPDRPLVGLATLTLLSGAANERPLVVVIDYAQWPDQVSAEVLVFVGKRPDADAVRADAATVILLALRDPYALNPAGPRRLL